MSITTILGTLELGCIFAILALGLYGSFRILNLPDLTVDGSFVTGCAFSSVATVAGHPFLGLLLALLGGMGAGIITGFLHTKCKIQAILAGILTMTALYSINLKITSGKPSVFFYGKTTVFSFLENKIFLMGVRFDRGVLLLALVIILTGLFYFFLKTQTGLALRATGDNEAMVRASSINTEGMKILGFAIANGLVALSGGLYSQYSQAYDHSVGLGMLVLGLASIIIGETIFGKKSLFRALVASVLGAIVYRFIIAFAFMLGLPASDLKLFSALIVILAITLPNLKGSRLKRRKRG